jgi:hypothetical protein
MECALNDIVVEQRISLIHLARRLNRRSEEAQPGGKAQSQSGTEHTDWVYPEP